MYSGLVGGLLFVVRAALLACVGRLAFIVRVCLRGFPALVPACLRIPNHRASPCNTYSCAPVGSWAWRAFCYQETALRVPSIAKGAGKDFRDGADVPFE